MHAPIVSKVNATLVTGGSNRAIAGGHDQSHRGERRAGFRQISVAVLWVPRQSRERRDSPEVPVV